LLVALTRTGDFLIKWVGLDVVGGGCVGVAPLGLVGPGLRVVLAGGLWYEVIIELDCGELCC
jgi:hypothetical protein